MFTFLHAADIHLDSPLHNLDCYDGAPVEVFRNATRQAFDRLIDLAIEEKVRFVLIAGDLYDGDCRDSKTPLHFRRQTAKLGEHGIQVFVIQGNHDAGVRRQEFRFQLPPNVTLFSTQAAETHCIEELGVADSRTRIRRAGDYGESGRELSRAHPRLFEHWAAAYQLRRSTSP